MRQTWAIIVDAYRLLNARRLFWISLGLSGIVVLAFAAVGVNDQGLSFFGWQTQLPPSTTTLNPQDPEAGRATFYEMLFQGLGVSFWIAWLATILALVSTAGLIPDFLSEGAIDLVLSKPIGRLRLFYSKYASGLLFVTLQVLVFCAASFFVLGLRGGLWNPMIFAAIPIVVLFYSYLFSVCAVIGLLTRSTIAALLLTLLFWFVIFGVNVTESALLTFREAHQVSMQKQQERIDDQQLRIADRQESGAITEEQLAEVNAKTASQEERLDASRLSLGTLTRFHRATMITKSLLPKTSETIGLLERWLIDDEELAQMTANQPGRAQVSASDGDDEFSMSDPEVQRETQARVALEIRSRSIWWVVGTSLGFEAIVLLIGGWIFARRDF